MTKHLQNFHCNLSLLKNSRLFSFVAPEDNVFKLIITYDTYIRNKLLKGSGYLYTERKLVVHIHELLKKEGWSLSKLALEADIDKSKLSRLASGQRESLYIDYLVKIAETLDIDDLNEIVSLERVDNDNHK